MKKTIVSLIVLALTFLAIAAVLIVTGHTEPVHNRSNTLGVSEVYQNPYSYLIGLPRDAQILEGKYTNVRIWPLGAPMLYDESLLLCGDVTEQFQGKQGVLAVAYETRAHAAYKSIGCHELLAVDEISTGK